MGRSIAIDLNPKFEIEIDGSMIAAALGLDQDTFFHLLEIRKIDQLCERGTDEDEGLYRASFYYENKRARVIVDRSGKLIGSVEATTRQPGRRSTDAD